MWAVFKEDAHGHSDALRPLLVFSVTVRFQGLPYLMAPASERPLRLGWPHCILPSEPEPKPGDREKSGAIPGLIQVFLIKPLPDLSDSDDLKLKRTPSQEVTYSPFSKLQWPHTHTETRTVMWQHLGHLATDSPICTFFFGNSQFPEKETRRNSGFA